MKIEHAIGIILCLCLFSYPLFLPLPGVAQVETPFVFITEWGANSPAMGYDGGIAIMQSPNGTLVYVTDTVNHRILKFHANGTFLSTFGSTGLQQVQMLYPTDIAIDSVGDLYVLDYQNGVFKYAANGTYIFSWPIAEGETQHTGQQGLTYDRHSESIYVADTAFGKILEFSTDGALLSSIGTPGQNDGELFSPYDVAIDSAGNVFVADSSNNRVQKFSYDGTYVGQWNKYGDGIDMYSPQSLAVDSDDNVYVAVGTIEKFANDGSYLGTVSQVDPLGQIQLNSLDISYDASTGSIFSLSNILNTQLIEVFASANAPAYERIARWTPETPTDNPRASIGSLDSDSHGNLYVVDTTLNRIQKYTSDGIAITKWGLSGSMEGEFQSPVDISIDNQDNVYVIDADNKRVQKFDSNGTFLMEWGGGSINDTYLPGRLAYPRSIDIDSQGQVFVSDIANRRISIYTANGTFFSQWNATDIPPDVPGNYFSDSGFFEAGKIAIDSKDNVFLIDARNILEPPYTYVRIAKFSPEGDLLASWSNYGDSEPLLSIADIAVDQNDNLLAIDYRNNTVAQFSPNGTLIARWGSSGFDSGKFSNLAAITASPTGLLYTGDSNNRIQVFAPHAIASQFDHAPQLTVPMNITANATSTGVRAMNITFDVTASDDNDPQSALRIECTPESGSPFLVGLSVPVVCHATDTKGNTSTKSFYVKINPAPSEPEVLPPASEQYQFMRKWGNRTDHAYLYAWKLASDHNDKLFVLSAAVGEYAVQVYNSSGFPVGQLVPYGLDEGQAYSPAGIAVDSAGEYVYISDSERDKVLRFSANGSFVKEWGHAIGDTYSPGNLSTDIGELAVDSEGNVYIIDTGNLRIQKFTASGDFISLWTLERSKNGEPAYPREIAIDSEDRVYVSDYDGRLQAFDTDGKFLKSWVIADSIDIATDRENHVYTLGQYGSNATKYDSQGNAVASLNITLGDAGMFAANSISIGADGSIFTGFNNGGIRKFSSDGKYLDSIVFTLQSIGNFRSPSGIALDPDYVYVVDNADNRVQKFTRNGTFVKQWQTAGNTFVGSGEATGIATDSQGNVFVTAGKLLKFSSEGELLSSWGATGEDENEFGALYAIEIDRKNNDTIYIADASKYLIHRFTADGIRLESWPVGDTGEQSGQQIWPQDIALDSFGNVYMLESFANQISKLSRDGDIITKLNVSRSGTDQFGRPLYAFRIEVDGQDNLYVGYFDGVVRKFAGNGTFLAQISSPGSSDGQVFFPTGIAADESGENLYVLDGGNVRVQHFSKAQVVPEYPGYLLVVFGASIMAVFAATRLTKSHLRY